MKKVIALIVLAAAMTLTAQAQGIKFGVKGGLNITKMKFSEDVFKSENKTGFFVGPTLKISLPMGFGVDIAAPAENNPGFEVASENFGVTFSDMTAITKANDLSAWNDEMTAMSSVISTYTTTTVVNS